MARAQSSPQRSLGLRSPLLLRRVNEAETRTALIKGGCQTREAGRERNSCARATEKVHSFGSSGFAAGPARLERKQFVIHTSSFSRLHTSWWCECSPPLFLRHIFCAIRLPESVTPSYKRRSGQNESRCSIRLIHLPRPEASSLAR